MHTTIDSGSRMPWALGFVDLFPTPLSDLQQDALQAFAHAVLRAPAREGDAHPHPRHVHSHAHVNTHAVPHTLPLPHRHAPAPASATTDNPREVIPLAMPEDLARSARAVSRALATLEVPLAKACARFCDDHAWEDCGYARQSDVSREVLGRSERWLRDRAALGRGLLAMPALERAMLGGDGGAALGVVAAGLIAAIADEDTAETWIARARQVSVAQLKADVRLLRDSLQQARGEGRRAPREGARARDAQGVTVAIWAPEPVHAAFDEALELHRAVCGRDESIASFIEALVAEAANGAQPMGTASADTPAVDAPGADASPFCDEGPRIIERREGHEDDGDREAALVGADSAPDSAPHTVPHPALHATPQLALDVDEWLRDHLLDGGALVPPAQAFVRRVLAAHGGHPSGDSSAASATTAASATATDSPNFTSTAPSSISSASPDGSLLDEIRTMLALEHEGEVLLAHCLADLSRSRALRGEGFETFVREVLGKSGAYARKLLAVVHAAAASPQLAEAWQSGTLTTDRARTLARAFARTVPDAATHAQWIADAREVTARRLRDAVRLVERERALAPRGQDDPRPTTPPPPGDEAWLASLRRAPGMAAARVRQLVSLAIEGNERLWPRCRRISLDRALADRFRAVLTERARWANGDAHVQHAFGRRWGVPHWVGLVTLLVEYTATHDDRDTFAATEAWRRRVLERDGYRCAVPGCSSRANLEVHHVAFRSAGGGNAPENLVTLCAYHHRRGVHGDGLRIRGAAPRGLAFGMGKRGRRVRWYRADRLLRVPPQRQRGQSPPL